jgi:hypothetical protein
VVLTALTGVGPWTRGLVFRCVLGSEGCVLVPRSIGTPVGEVCLKPCSSCWSFHLLREEFLSAPIHSPPLSGSPFRSFTCGPRTIRTVCILRGLHISRPSSGSSCIFDTLLSSVFGTRRPLPFRFLVFRMPTLRGVESIGNRLRVLANFWYPHLFIGLLANILV